MPETLSLPDGRPVLLRLAEPADAAAILAYLRRVGGETPYLTFGAEGPGFTEEEERAHLERVRDADNAVAILAMSGEEIVGLVTFEAGVRARIRHIGEFGISVVRAAWGSGVGPALLDALLAWARASGVVHKLILRVRADNARAIALYERTGFEHEGRITREICVDGEYHDALLMGIWVGDGVGTEWGRSRSS